MSVWAGNGEVALGWDRTEDGDEVVVLDYAYRYSTDGGASWGGWVNLAGGRWKPGVVVGGLTNGTTYSFQVRAVTHFRDYSRPTPEQGLPSDPVTATPGERWRVTSLKTVHRNSEVALDVLVHLTTPSRLGLFETDQVFDLVLEDTDGTNLLAGRQVVLEAGKYVGRLKLGPRAVPGDADGDWHRPRKLVLKALRNGEAVASFPMTLWDDDPVG